MKTIKLITENSYLKGYDEKGDLCCHLPLNNASFLEGVDVLPPFTRHQEDDVEELAELNGHPESSGFCDYKEGFLDGFLEAKEKYKYTNEDMRKSYYKGAADCHDKCTERNWRGVEIKVNIDELIELCTKYIQSLSQPKMPIAFECETEITHIGNGTYSMDDMDLSLTNLNPIKVIKTTTNSQGQTQWVGKYIYA